MVFKIPANHVFNIKKIPDLEIQINHIAINDPSNPIQYIMVSQTYIMTNFQTGVNTVLS